MLYTEILLHQTVIIFLPFEHFLFWKPIVCANNVVIQTEDPLVWVTRNIVVGLVWVWGHIANLIKSATRRIRWMTKWRLTIYCANKLIFIADFSNLVILKSDRTARLFQRLIWRWLGNSTLKHLLLACFILLDDLVIQLNLMSDMHKWLLCYRLILLLKPLK